MSNHHHQSREEQINNKIHGVAQMQQDNMSYHKSERIKSEDIPMQVFVDDSAIQLRAYQIYHEKGGSALENWLEAERLLKKNGMAH